MRTLSGPHLHAEIVGLIDRAQRFVVLVSPFVRPWPELRMALGRAVGRGVRVNLYTRGGRGGPGPQDLRVFDDLDAEIREARHLHQKVYLSESEALMVSANLTWEAVGHALEGGTHARRDEDGGAWLAAAELWLQTRDACVRETEADDEVSGVAFDLALGKDPPPDGHCITCARPLHGDDARCLPCRAESVSRDQDPDQLPWRFCPECGAAWAGSPERPICGACYRAANAVRPASWWVVGEAGAIDAWSAADVHSANAATAIANRIVLSFPEGGGLYAEVSRAGRARLDPLALAFPRGLTLRRSLFVERRPAGPGPLVAPLAHLPPTEVSRVLYRHVPMAPDSAWWAPERTLAAFATDLTAPTSPVKVPVDWFWKVLLAVRPAEPTEALDPDRTLLWLDLHLTVPEPALDQWRGHADALRGILLQALHPVDPELGAILKHTLPESVRTPVLARARTPGLLAPVPPVKRKGRPVDLGARPDRVAVTRLWAEAGDRWAVAASVRTVRKRPVS